MSLYLTLAVLAALHLAVVAKVTLWLVARESASDQTGLESPVAPSAPLA